MSCMYQFYSTLVIICAEAKGVREEVCEGSKVSLFASLEATLSHGEAIGAKWVWPVVIAIQKAIVRTVHMQIHVPRL